jgi:hypothetical protein
MQGGATQAMSLHIVDDKQRGDCARLDSFTASHYDLSNTRDRMHNPHEAREDTVLFPAFRGLVRSSEYNALGEEFEKKENMRV